MDYICYKEWLTLYKIAQKEGKLLIYTTRLLRVKRVYDSPRLYIKLLKKVRLYLEDALVYLSKTKSQSMITTILRDDQEVDDFFKNEYISIPENLLK